MVQPEPNEGNCPPSKGAGVILLFNVCLLRARNVSTEGLTVRPVSSS